MGCRLQTLVLGEIAPRGDVYGASHPQHLERRQERPLDSHSRQAGGLG